MPSVSSANRRDSSMMARMGEPIVDRRANLAAVDRRVAGPRMAGLPPDAGPDERPTLGGRLSDHARRSGVGGCRAGHSRRCPGADRRLKRVEVQVSAEDGPCDLIFSDHKSDALGRKWPAKWTVDVDGKTSLVFEVDRIEVAP